MFPIKRLDLLAVVFLVSVLGGGCTKGPKTAAASRPAASEAGGPAPAPAPVIVTTAHRRAIDELGLALVGPRSISTAGPLEPARVGARDRLTELEPAILDDYQLQLSRPILLPDGATEPELFLTFYRLMLTEPNGVTQAPESATYTVWTREHGQALAALAPPAEAHVDAESGRFYVPLNEIFGDRKTRVALQQPFSIVIDLHYSNGRVAEFKVHFHAIGFPPAVIPRPRPTLVSTPDVTAFASRIPMTPVEAPAEMVVFSEEITNSAPRPLTLWLQSDANAELHLNSLIRHLVWTTPPSGPYPIQATRFTAAAAAFRMSSVVVIGSQPAPVVLRDLELSSLEIGAGQTVQIEWRARAVEGTRGCVLQPTSQKVLDWSNVPDACPYDALHGCNHWEWDTAHRKPLTDLHVLAGMTFSGQWKRKVILAEPIFTPEQIREPARLEAALRSRVLVLTDGYRAETAIGGTVAETGAASPDGCQGVF